MFFLFGASFFGPLLFPALIAIVTFVFYKRFSERQREDEQIRLLRLRRQNGTAPGSSKKIFTRKRKEIDCKLPQKLSVCFNEITVFYATETGKSKVKLFYLTQILFTFDWLWKRRSSILFYQNEFVMFLKVINVCMKKLNYTYALLIYMCNTFIVDMFIRVCVCGLKILLRFSRVKLRFFVRFEIIDIM